MKPIVYTGDREYGVRREGYPFSPERSQGLCDHSPTGFEWGYGGSGPAQLALALLLDVTHSEELSLQFYQEFKWQMIANLPDSWEMTSDDIHCWVTREKKRRWYYPVWDQVVFGLQAEREDARQAA